MAFAPSLSSTTDMGLVMENRFHIYMYSSVGLPCLGDCLLRQKKGGDGP